MALPELADVFQPCAFQSVFFPNTLVFLSSRPETSLLVRLCLKRGQKGPHSSTFFIPLILLCRPRCSLTSCVIRLNSNLSPSLLSSAFVSPSLSRSRFLNILLSLTLFLSLFLLPPLSLPSLSLFYLISYPYWWISRRGGHSGLLLKISVSEMCVIFLLNWIICIYLPPSVLTPALTRESVRAS